MYYLIAIPLLLVLDYPLISLGILVAIALLIAAVQSYRCREAERDAERLRLSHLAEDADRQNAAGEDSPYGLYGQHLPAREILDDLG